MKGGASRERKKVFHTQILPPSIPHRCCWEQSHRPATDGFPVEQTVPFCRVGYPSHQPCYQGKVHPTAKVGCLKRKAQKRRGWREEVGTFSALSPGNIKSIGNVSRTSEQVGTVHVSLQHLRCNLNVRSFAWKGWDLLHCEITVVLELGYLSAKICLVWQWSIEIVAPCQTDKCLKCSQFLLSWVHCSEKFTLNSLFPMWLL